MLTLSIYVAGSAGLPGIGDIGNPVDEIRSDNGDGTADAYKVKTQLRVTSTALGDTELSGFTYQTQKDCTFCLSIGDARNLAIGGANDVKADVRVVNKDSGKVYVQTTKFLGEISAGGSKDIEVEWNNAPSGTYLVEYEVDYDPSVSDPTDLDNIKTFEKNIEVPKVVN